MKIPVKLNKKKIILNADPAEKLLTVLRREKIYSPKCGCEKGMCGNCMVLLDDECVPSCIVPVGIVRDCEIETLEEFVKRDIFQDIKAGFAQAGIHTCGYCDAGKIFTVYSVLKKYFRPTVEQISVAIKNLDCCCTDLTTLSNGILYAVAAKHKRELGEEYAKK